MSARRVLTIAAAAVLLSLATISTSVPPCVEEDSAGPCFWDASTRGNGVGQSFTVDSAQVAHYAATR